MPARNPLIHAPIIRRRRIIHGSIAGVVVVLALASIASHLGGSDWRLDGRTFVVSNIAEEPLIELAPEAGGRAIAVRLLGLSPRAEDWSSHAHEHLERLSGRKVLLRLEPLQARDSAGRLQGYLYVDGRQINSDLARQGLARIERGRDHTFATAMSQAESAARRKRLGVWARGEAPSVTEGE